MLASSSHRPHQFGLSLITTFALTGPACARGSAEPPEPEPAQSPLDGECKAGSALACRTLAEQLYARDDAAETARLHQLLRRGCELDDANACAQLADLYGKAEDGRIDVESALPLYDRACALGDLHSCGDLGFFLLFDGHRPREPTRAIERSAQPRRPARIARNERVRSSSSLSPVTASSSSDTAPQASARRK